MAPRRFRRYCWNPHTAAGSVDAWGHSAGVLRGKAGNLTGVSVEDNLPNRPWLGNEPDALHVHSQPFAWLGTCRAACHQSRFFPGGSGNEMRPIRLSAPSDEQAKAPGCAAGGVIVQQVHEHISIGAAGLHPEIHLWRPHDRHILLQLSTGEHGMPTSAEASVGHRSRHAAHSLIP